MQVFIGRGKKKMSEDEFERRLYILRKSISNAIYRRRERRTSGYYPVSISCRTVIYKGMFLADQLGTYYPDLHDPDFESALALVHQRFSTNTFPTCRAALPTCSTKMKASSHVAIWRWWSSNRCRKKSRSPSRNSATTTISNRMLSLSRPASTVTIFSRRFKGQPEHVINYFFFVAEEVRELMAELGFRAFDEMVGQMQMLDRRKLVEHWKAKGLDFSKLFTKPTAEKGTAIYKCEEQDHKIKDILDRKLITEAQTALDRGAPVRLQAVIRNTDRACGGMMTLKFESIRKPGPCTPAGTNRNA